MTVLRNPRLVRLRDRLTLGPMDGGAVWRINPRNGFLESRAGLTWTGVREYRTATGVLRVLRRFEQVEAPAHLRTLRLLPATDQHPSGDRDVTPENEAELRVGQTGDAIDIETLDGYRRPVGNVSVSRPSTMVKMVDASTWAEIVEQFPALGDVKHSGAAPCTGTSLGYNALWLGPSVDAEIRGERDDGSLWGEWEGPNGPEPYDVEHIVDPECDIVQKLVRDGRFNPDKLGGNHFAVALKALHGRGAEQSELMRMIDSIDVPIGFDPDRTRMQVQVNKFRSTPSVHGRIVASLRDANTTRIVMSEQATKIVETISIGVGRDNETVLRKRGLQIPQPIKFTVDEVDAPKLAAAIEAVQTMLSDVLAMLGSAEGKVAEMEDEVKSGEMLSKEQAGALVKQKEDELAQAKEQLSKATDKVDQITKERDAALAELGPLRDEKLQQLRDMATKLGIDEAKVKDAKDAAAVRRLVVLHKVKNGAEKYAEGKATDDAVAHAFEGLMSVVDVQPQVEEQGEPTRDAQNKSGLSVIPMPTLPQQQAARDGAPKTRAQEVADQMSAGMTVLGG